jgi:3-oxoacyl-[acyl-carrier-protein] synthase-3
MSESDNLLGIADIGIYIPESKLSNQDKKSLFEIDDNFLNNKIGIEYTTRKNAGDETSDLCVKAFQNLQEKTGLDKTVIKCVIVVTQNPDGDGLPHTSAIVHSKLGLADDCAAFDISLGCSGFVYGLSVIESFMSANHIEAGLLFTCDPYSKIVNPQDKNTSLLFGDAASVTLINKEPRLKSLAFSFGTRGSESAALFSENRVLTMDGRAVFNFSAVEVPVQIRKILETNDLTLAEIDLFLLHQGSKYIIDTITKRLGIGAEKVPTNLKNIGNTVSSSIPLLLNEYLYDDTVKKILLSGFGVGLSWASGLLERVNHSD